MNFLIVVANDYPPYVWVEENISYAKEYIDACTRYITKNFSDKYGLSVNVEYVFECPSTIYPSTCVQSTIKGESAMWTEATFNAVASDAHLPNHGGYDGVLFISRHKVKENPALYERSNAIPWAHWAYVTYDPPVLTKRLIWRYLFRLHHEMLHLILWNLGNKPMHTSDLDKPPYSDIKYVSGFWEVLFEDIYPVQMF